MKTEDRPHEVGYYTHEIGEWNVVDGTPRFTKQGTGFTKEIVEETSASGRFCRRLKMGGSVAMTGFSEWSGRWTPILY